MNRRLVPAWAAGITVAYFVLSLGSVWSFSLGPPAWLEQGLSLLAAPALLLLLVWNPLLRPLGLTSGEWVVGPSGPACVLLILMYASLVYGLARLLCGGPRRSRDVHHP
ncbi:hypothetical protein [Archangium lipolyticum]|uniref:hypothetical protein n=1 Tax=Archangium lipolyticum TaxID=2970465 RepID=UPI00214A5B1D|nr:hypothetical protein [Archangium lipolyticum]